MVMTMIIISSQLSSVINHPYLSMHKQLDQLPLSILTVADWFEVKVLGDATDSQICRKTSVPSDRGSVVHGTPVTLWISPEFTHVHMAIVCWTVIVGLNAWCSRLLCAQLHSM